MTGIHHCSGITHLSIKDYKHPNKIGKIQEPEHKTSDRAQKFITATDQLLSFDEGAFSLLSAASVPLPAAGSA